MKFGLFLYPGVEPIDLATIGVVSMARRVIPQLEYLTVAVSHEPVTLSNGLRVMPDHAISDQPDMDLLIVPGGPGWESASADEQTLDYLRARAALHNIASVCTGAMLVANAGLLDGKMATTKVEVFPPERSPLQVMADRHPQIRAKHALVVDEGAVVTGGGVALCIDMMLYLLERDFGAAKAAEVARIIEYESAFAANRDRLEIVAEVANRSHGINKSC